jgi:hypothetical protein
MFDRSNQPVLATKIHSQLPVKLDQLLNLPLQLPANPDPLAK